ncbi:MAG: type 1 glutamine amidotransferase domain-containing protein [Polyangiales bacterium]
MPALSNIKVAILVADGFEQSELTEPRKALEEAGVKTTVVSPQSDKVRGMKHHEWSDSVNVDLPLEAASPKQFDALLLPGGVFNPDALRMNPKAVEFARGFFDANKPVAAICHGPWLVVESGAARGRKLASWPSLKTDIQNAGGEWVDKPVVVDKNLITSRNPGDIPAFNRALIERLSQ